MTNLEMKGKNLEFLNDLRNLSDMISKLNDYDDLDVILQRMSDSDLKGLYDASLDSFDGLKELVKCQEIAINIYRKEVDRRNRERKGDL